MYSKLYIQLGQCAESAKRSIPEDILKQMVDAGIRAPSGSNRQGWKFIVVTDQEIKNQLGIPTEKHGIFM